MTDNGCLTGRQVTTFSHMTDDLISTGQVAKTLDIDRRTVWQRVKSGRLTPTVKLEGVNGAYLFNRAEIEASKECVK